jgi:1,4-alpha-glucan branching enzyme
MSSTTQEQRTMTFSIRAEGAGRLFLAGDFNDWQPIEMIRHSDGHFELQLEPDAFRQGRFIMAGQWKGFSDKHNAPSE